MATKKPGVKEGPKALIFIVLAIATLLAVFPLLSKIESSQQISRAQSLDLTGQPFIGKEDAPLTLVEFGDYKCPSCGFFALETLPQLQKEFIDSGKLKVYFIDTLFHGEESRLASLTAESVYTQNKEVYWSLNKALFEEIVTSKKPVTTDLVLDVASKFADQIDIEKLKVDIEKGTYQKALDHDQQLVKSLGVDVTPTLLLNGVIVEETSVDDLRKKFNEVLGAE